MRKVYVIGIGAGDPEQLTLQAVRALRELDVVFVIDKGSAKSELVELRQLICSTHIPGPVRVVTAADPERDRDAADYTGAVADWYDARAEVFAGMFATELDESGVGGILVWGDPALYDSTLRVLDRVLARGDVAFSVEVVPGITSVQALAARHRVLLTRVGAPVHITTGRRLAAGMPADLDDVLVMLDGKAAFKALPDTDLDIFWGAYLGMPDEILVAGDLQDCKDRIVRVRAEARERKGWIMDTYLLRRRRPDADLA
jgi:precorrin-6A synthase